ncbi:hypothetical protein BCT04_14240 [Vibrio breoganii]|uniref:hypothetical protein n=1 Tax=Vibrio breoganii TaxID=553239 RepID=UPI000CC3464E|nr:hypothetical protein [Vibrio breoganii]PMO64177.1 hypothetical protein BCT04_14240 [Vibrio breoganii]
MSTQQLINRAHMKCAHFYNSASRLFEKLQGEESTIARAVEVNGRYVGHLFISEQEGGWELGFIQASRHEDEYGVYYLYRLVN